jgi:hypothetical protein
MEGEEPFVVGVAECWLILCQFASFVIFVPLVYSFGIIEALLI